MKYIAVLALLVSSSRAIRLSMSDLGDLELPAVQDENDLQMAK